MFAIDPPSMKPPTHSFDDEDDDGWVILNLGKGFMIVLSWKEG